MKYGSSKNCLTSRPNGSPTATTELYVRCTIHTTLQLRPLSSLVVVASALDAARRALQRACKFERAARGRARFPARVCVTPQRRSTRRDDRGVVVRAFLRPGPSVVQRPCCVRRCPQHQSGILRCGRRRPCGHRPGGFEVRPPSVVLPASCRGRRLVASKASLPASCIIEGPTRAALLRATSRNRRNLWRWSPAAA